MMVGSFVCDIGNEARLRRKEALLADRSEDLSIHFPPVHETKCRHFGIASISVVARNPPEASLKWVTIPAILMSVRGVPIYRDDEAISGWVAL